MEKLYSFLKDLEKPEWKYYDGDLINYSNRTSAKNTIKNLIMNIQDQVEHILNYEICFSIFKAFKDDEEGLVICSIVISDFRNILNYNCGAHKDEITI